MRRQLLLSGLLAGLVPAVAMATPFTTTSPLGGTIPAAATPVGGLVLDLQGTNGTRVFAQAAASTLFVGTQNVTNLAIGSLVGFTPAITGALGGGLSGAALRVTLDDGDSAVGEFNFNESTIQVDGVDFGNVSLAAVEETNSTGTTALSTGTGFRDGTLDTGWFALLDPAALNMLFTALLDESVTFTWTDSELDGNFLDFTQGVDGGLINIGTGPIITPPPGGGTNVSTPASFALLGAGLVALGLVRRRRIAA